MISEKSIPMTANDPNKVPKLHLQNIVNIVQDLKAVGNYFDSLRLSHGVVPTRGDLIIISKDFMEELKQVGLNTVPYWVKSSPLLPNKYDGYILRGEWVDELLKITT